MKHSLRGRLVLWQILGITLLLATSGFATHAIVEGYLRRELDKAVVITARSLLPGLRRELAVESRDPGPGPAPGVIAPTERTDALFEVRDVDGTSLLRSESLGEVGLPAVAAELSVGELLEGAVAETRIVDIELPDGRPGRALAFLLPIAPRRALAPDGRPFPDAERPRPGERLRAGRGRRGEDDDEARRGRAENRERRRERFLGPPEEGGPYHAVVVAAEAETLAQRLGDLRALLLLSWLACSAGSAALLSWAVHRSLRPLGKLSRQIETLTGDRLQRRFDLPDAPAELEPVVAELNHLLGRIQAAFDREQAFTADAAHELRTPLAGLRSTLEVALHRDRTPAEYRGAAQQALDVTVEMQALVGNLLLLARSGADAEANTEDVRLVDVVAPMVAAFADAADARGVSLSVEADPRHEVRTDPALVERIVANLVENAVAYADEGGAVEISTRVTGEFVELAVANPVTGATPELAERAFQAFWRANPARDGTGQHAGLGLSLCKRIIEHLGGELDAELEGSVFTVRARFPAVRPA